MSDNHLSFSRRSLLLGSGALLAGAVLPFGPGFAAGTDQPRKGGHLVLGINGASSSDRLDPATYPELYTYVVGAQLFNTLIELDDGRLKPALAESWDARNGGADWVLKLRKGVQFHNGKTLTAADVIYSLNHHRGEKSQSAVKVYLDTVRDIRETAPLEITISLTEPNADLPYLLADVHFGITPDGADFEKGIGTGAFILETFQPGVRTLTRRNPNHWQAGRGHVDTVETLAFNDSTARIAALLSGKIHIANRIDPKLLGKIGNSPKFKIYRSADSDILTLPGRFDQAPFNSKDARLALKYAIDREQILKSVLSGYGSIGNDQPIVPSNPYFAADIKPLPYDPDKAAYHWKKAGYDGRVVLSAADAGFPGGVDVAQLYQASARKAGVPLEIERVPDDGYWSNVWLKKPFVVSNWATRPTADAILTLVYLSTAEWNESAWRNPQFDQLIRQARGELNEDRRRQQYHDIQRILSEDSSALVSVRSDLLDAASVKVKGFVTSPGLALSSLRAPEKVWLEA